MTGTIWEQVLGRIETKVNNHTYLTWFENTSLLRDSGSNILVQVVDPMAELARTTRAPNAESQPKPRHRANELTELAGNFEALANQLVAPIGRLP